MFYIASGTGKNYLAEVNEFNQLEVLSESIPSEGVQSQRGNGFIIHAECQTASASSGALMSITNNDSNYNLEITRIYIDPHVITPSDLIVTQVFDAILSGGTDVSSSAVVQKNRGSAQSFDLSVLISDSSSNLTYSGGDQYHSFPVTSMSEIQRNIRYTNILPRGKSVTFGWKTSGGGNATDGEIVSLSVNVVRRPS
jgi:hypothetical protein